MLWLDLTLAFISAIAVNWAYAREHDAAAAMPPFSPRSKTTAASLPVYLERRKTEDLDGSGGGIPDRP